MTLIRAKRVASGMQRSIFKAVCVPGSPAKISSTMAPACSRCFNRGPPWRRDPFSQMEEFMRDMERKFKRDIDSSLSSFFREFPRVGETLSQPISSAVTRPGFGHVENLSTEEKYKLAFNFSSAKPEDIKVKLKDRTLTVTGQAKTSTETSRSSYETSIEYQLPDGVDVDALESSLSHDGILTIEAPQITPEEPQTPQPIDINRE
ncbi:heat shock protein beta-1-like [Homarus americanus]|uniref:Heat shock protein Hsp-16.2-like n=1 Tax=Homarus americanus TaxID=6706 RepID=A0A8J5MY81_HOMAM|nr:heat shock protein beta-1-like [Homarus americanus]XP_042221952.1 heat shock protein beta-1-like [Homarus americanus]XP_042221954.1 heat shock protein beta-1-like [Homarus americanus]KAG7168875.1 Heat shock protein Hsp-16.2-like [Homarus americanus]